MSVVAGDGTRVNDSRGAEHVRFMRRTVRCVVGYTTIRNQPCHVYQNPTAIMHIREDAEGDDGCMQRKYVDRNRAT